jgi:hypothetical protein
MSVMIGGQIMVCSTGFAWADWAEPFEPGPHQPAERSWRDQRRVLREPAPGTLATDDRLRRAVLGRTG